MSIVTHASQLTVAELQAMVERSAFHRQFHPTVLGLDLDRLQLRIGFAMSAGVERQPHTRQWHGGAIAAIVDIAGSYAVGLLGAEPLPTVNFRTDFMRPAVATDLVSVALVRRAGRRIGVVDVDVLDAQQRLVAVGRGCYSMQAFS